MGSPERIQSVARRVAKWARAGHQMVVVPSAMSGETNRLLALARQLAPESTTTEILRARHDRVDRRAGLVGLLAIALHAEGVPAVSYAGWQVPIATDSSYTKARIERIDDARVAPTSARARSSSSRLPGRRRRRPRDDARPRRLRHVGGRDRRRTAGRRVPDLHRRRRRLHHRSAHRRRRAAPPTISFEEMLEMASLGPKVLQIRSVEFAGKYRVPLRPLELHAVGHRHRRGSPVGYAHHLRGRRQDGTSRRVGNRLQPRRGQDQPDGVADSPASPT